MDDNLVGVIRDIIWLAGLLPDPTGRYIVVPLWGSDNTESLIFWGSILGSPIHGNHHFRRQKC